MNSDFPLVSIIIPVYNCEKYIQKCISTITAQTWPSIQIIIVNDGSTDKSVDIINCLAKKNKWITVLHQVNKGVAAARNHGVAHAQGEYLLFIDGDDYVAYDYVEKLTLAAIRHEAELVICGYTLTNQDGIPYRRICPDAYEKGDNEAWAYRICSVLSRLYLKKFWDNNKLRFVQERNARGEDVPLSLYANAMAHNITVINESGYYYVQHQGSAMHNFKGFSQYHFPYRTIADLTIKLHDIQITNSRKWFTFGVLKLFAQFIFVLSGGARRTEIRKLCSYIETMVKKYYTNAWQDMKHLFSHKTNVPIEQKLSIYIMLVLIKLKLLEIVILVFSRKLNFCRNKSVRKGKILS